MVKSTINVLLRQVLRFGCGWDVFLRPKAQAYVVSGWLLFMAVDVSAVGVDDALVAPRRAVVPTRRRGGAVLRALWVRICCWDHCWSAHPAGPLCVGTAPKMCCVGGPSWPVVAAAAAMIGMESIGATF